MVSVLLEQAGVLDLEHLKQHFRFAFECPPGVQALRVSFEFDVWQVGSLLNMLNLSLYDPHGFRGAGHRHGRFHQILLDAAGATPGYMSGPLEAGRWEAVVHTHMVLCQTAYTLKVEALEEPFDWLHLAPLPTRPMPTAAWLKGDFHCHTVHSDAKWTTLELAQAAEARGLDFVALTDHNTRSGTPELKAVAPGLIVLEGEELTTYYGHALVLGLARMSDWTGFKPHAGVSQLAADVREQGGLMVIAHPLAVGDPICTGCSWTYFDYRPEQASHFEVWNSLWSGRSHNEQALQLWYSFLEQGKRIVATAGTDAHGMDYHLEHGFTFVQAQPDAHSILNALKQGRTYLSRGLPLEFKILGAQGEVWLGDLIPAQTLGIELQMPGANQTYTLIAVVDGERRAQPWAGEAITLEAHPKRWWNLEIRRVDGTLEALTNPVWIEEKQA